MYNICVIRNKEGCVLTLQKLREISTNLTNTAENSLLASLEGAGYDIVVITLLGLARLSTSYRRKRKPGQLLKGLQKRHSVLGHPLSTEGEHSAA